MRGCMIAGSDRLFDMSFSPVRQPQCGCLVKLPVGALRQGRRFLLIFPAALLMLGLRYGACELVTDSQPQTYAATGPRRY